MKSRSAAALLILALAAPAAAFMSPEGLYRVDVLTGANAKGSDVKPITVAFTPAAPRPAINATFQLIRYSEPTERTVQEAFRWPPGEAAVAIENRSAMTNFGFRLIALDAALPWKRRDLTAVEVEWIDRNRMVYRGDGEDNDGFFIAVFDARTGKSRVAHRNISRYTTCDVVSFDDTSVTFHERTSGGDDDRCFRFNTVNGGLKTLPCK